MSAGKEEEKALGAGCFSGVARTADADAEVKAEAEAEAEADAEAEAEATPSLDVGQKPAGGTV